MLGEGGGGQEQYVERERPTMTAMKIVFEALFCGLVVGEIR